MRIMKKLIFLISFIIIAVGAVVLFLSTDAIWDYDVENARRLSCQVKQERIYSALNKYYTQHKRLPSELRTLVQQGYIQKDIIYCPSHCRDLKAKPYKYFPKNFGDPNLPLISESIENHNGKRLRLKKLRPVVIETMGDGTTKIRTLNIEQ